MDLDAVRAVADRARKAQAAVDEIVAVPLPPEAAAMYAKLAEMHPDCKVTFERRIFLRATNDMDICVDVRNVPDQ